MVPGEAPGYRVADLPGAVGGRERTGGVVPEPRHGQVQGRVTPVEHVRQLRDEKVVFHALRGRGGRDPGRIVR
jgi:hypothetical protein